MEVLYVLIAILISLILIIMLCNFIYCKYYVDPTESYPLATITIVISMTIGLICILLIPIDIFLITFKGDTVTNISIDRSNLKAVIYLIYAILLFVAFVLVPFAYFYADSGIEEINAGNTNDITEKVCHSLKYTLVFILFCVILILCGLFFKQGNQGLTQFKWINKILDTEHREQAISFVISVLSVLGMLFLIFYTGYGLGSFPLFLIKGKKSLSTAHQEIEFDKVQIRDRIRALLEKSGKRNLSQKEKKELNKLRDDEQNLDKKLSKISSVLESDALVNKILIILTPFRFAIGVVSLSISILILVSLFVTSLDKYLNSACGLKCGFVLEQKNYTNYMDSLLLYLSKYLHLDHIIFAVMNIYVYICSIYGFVQIGVRFLCFTVVEIKKKNTLPQGLLIGAFLLSIMILAFMLEIQTLAPQYSTFGTQTFKNSYNQETIPCNLGLTSNFNLKEDECIISNIAQFSNRISVSFPFFSLIFYTANWLLIVVLLISLIYSSFFKKEDIMNDLDNDDFDEKMSLREFENTI